MGWWSTYYGGKAPRGKDRLDIVLRQEELVKPTDHGEAVDAAIVGSTVYVAYHEYKTDRVYAIIFLTFWKEGCLYVKSMDESTGPCEDKCPARILRKLSPLNDTVDPHGWAAGWRKRCAQKRKTLADLPLWTKIQLKNPQQTMLTVMENRKGRRIYLGDGYRVSAKRINAIGWEVV